MSVRGRGRRWGRDGGQALAPPPSPPGCRSSSSTPPLVLFWLQGKLDNVVELLFSAGLPSLPFLPRQQPVDPPTVRATLRHDYKMQGPGNTVEVGVHLCVRGGVSVICYQGFLLRGSATSPPTSHSSSSSIRHHLRRSGITSYTSHGNKTGTRCMQPVRSVLHGATSLILINNNSPWT